MVGTRPWRIASSASSGGVQAVMGRPSCSGGRQARFTISTICSAVNVAGAPGRGISANTRSMAWASAAGSSFTARRRWVALAQRPRHLVTVASARANRRASGALPCPLAAPTMTLIRWASPWEQEGRRSSPVSTVCWAGLTLMGRGHGPGIGTATWTNSTWPARTPLTTPTLPHPLTHFRAAVLVGHAANSWR